MNHYILAEQDFNLELESLINICKSSSLVTGKKLRDAHYRLGELLAPKITHEIPNKQLTVVVLPRAGLCVALGISDAFESMGYEVSVVFVDGNDISLKDFQYIENKNVLVVDAVINTGNSIFCLESQLEVASRVVLATTVIPKQTIGLLENYVLYCVRASENVYVGSKIKTIKAGNGPDTGDRLFNTF